MATELYGQATVPSLTPEEKKSRWETRMARREEAARIAREASRARSGSKTTADVIAEAERRLQGTNTAGALAVIEAVAQRERDLYLLVEEFGQNRKGVLRQFGTPGYGARAAFLQASGLRDPNESPETAGQEG